MTKFARRQMNRVVSLVKALRRQRESIRSRILRRGVAKRKALYEALALSERYHAYPEMTFIVQSFNKAPVVAQILDRLLSYDVQNIILIDDGSIDNTYRIAKQRLLGRDHLIIRANDLHEVSTYRLALRLVTTKYACLMQDDDLPPKTSQWVSTCIRLFEFDEKLLVLGLRDGINYRYFGDGPMQRDSIYQTDGQRFWIDEVFAGEVVVPSIRLDEELYVEYCQIVNRAPVVLRVDDFLAAGGIDPAFAPFQNDDEDYCLRTWQHGNRVMIISGLTFHRDVGIGGMRAFNDIARNRRTQHMCDNWARVSQRYRSFVNSGEVMRLVNSANREFIANNRL